MAEGITKKRQGRSPAYPSVPLGVALEKAEAQFEKEGKYPAPLSLAFKAWGYSPKSSGGRDVRASLRYFGLTVVEGEGNAAKVKLTEDALRVITDKREDQTEKNGIIRRLALNPMAHKKLWAKFPDGIKSDANAAHYLQWDEGYNGTAADAVVAEFKETAAFARLYEPDSVGGIQSDDGAPPSVQVGDFVRWTSGGVDQFSSAQVIAIADDGEWLWIEGESKAAIPMSEVQVVSPPAGQNAPPTPPAEVLAAWEKTKTAAGVTDEEKFVADEGAVIVRYPNIMASTSVDDLEEFFKFVIKKARRRAEAHAKMVKDAAPILYPDSGRTNGDKSR